MRLEYKFIVPMSQLNNLRAGLLPFVERDKFAAQCEGGQYTVRSIYFDTPGFDCYHDAVEGVRVRKKIRVRAYNAQQEHSIAFLEIKKKVNQRGMKHRAIVRVAGLEELFATKDIKRCIVPGRDADTSYDNAQRFFFHIEYRSMKPLLLVTYEREAFQGKVDPLLRITLDKNLRYLAYPSFQDLYEENRLQHVAPRFFILEIKFDKGYAPWLQQLVEKYNLQRTRMSKYSTTFSYCTSTQSLMNGRFVVRVQPNGMRRPAREAVLA